MSQHTNLVIFIGDVGDAITKILPLNQTLSTLNLGNNDFTGKLIACFIDRPVTNTNLVIFVGNIPTEIGQLTALTRLQLDDNKLSGKIITTMYQNSMENHVNRHVTY